MLVDLAEGAQHSGSVGGVSAPVSVSLLEGSRSLDTEGRTVSPVAVGLADGSHSSGLEGGAVSPVLVGFAKGAHGSQSPEDTGCNGGQEAISSRGRQEQQGGDFGYVGKGKA